VKQTLIIINWTLIKKREGKKNLGKENEVTESMKKGT
jgi:hypothetical protein